MQNGTQSQKRRRRGFTLIEVLMVVVLLAVLTKLAVASFSDTRYQAYDDAMTNDMHQLMVQEEIYYNANSAWALGTTTNTASTLTDGTTALNFLSSPDVNITVAANGLGYDITATHDKYPGRTCTVSVVQGSSASPSCS